MDKGREEVLLHRKPAVGRLHPEGPADAGHFARETLLAGDVADVLNDGVAEDYVEGLVAEGEAQPSPATQVAARARSAGPAAC